MKKRILSVLLAALMLLSVCPLVLPAAASAPEYTAADYDALYVQDGLTYAIDFFATNSYWGEPAVSTTDKTAGAEALSSFITKGAEYPFQFNGASASTVIRDGYFLNNAAVNQLLVDTRIDRDLNYAYDGATMQMVGVMEPTSLTTSLETGLTFANIRLGVRLSGGSLLLDAVALQSMEDAGFLVQDLGLALTTGTQTTYTLTVDRPTDTRTFYSYNYGVTGAVPPTASQYPDYKLVGNSFYVTHVPTYDEGTVVAMTEIPTLVAADHVFAYARYRPEYVEFEGNTYIVGAINRLTDDSGVEPYWHDVTTDPGHLGLYENGEPIYENDAVRFPNNAGYAASTYWRLWGQGNDMATYAMRYYDRILTADEMTLNHAADLMKWFRLDITRYSRLDTAARLTVAAALADYDFTADPEELGTLIDGMADSLTYDVLLDGLTEGTPAYATAESFLATAKEYLLDVSDILLFPPEYRVGIYDAVNSYVGEKSFASLSTVIDESVALVLETYYGSYIDKTVYQYRDLYVRQDQLAIAIDFFAATPEDGDVYVGVSYDEWLAEYEDYRVNWRTYGSDKGGPFATQNDALVYVREHRSETARPNNWADVVSDKYLWRGSTADIQPLDISDRNYPHNNIRTFGDGRLVCSLNNSLVVKYGEDATDVTYQVVSKSTKSTSWQLRGFRVGWSGKETSLSIASLNYQSYGVGGTEASPKPNASTLYSITPDPKPTIATTYSTDMTAVADKRMGVDTGHYYKYEWDPTTSKYTVTELPSAVGNNSGLISYYGRLDLSVYANGQYMTGFEDLPYSSSAPDSIGNGGANEFFAIRVYSCTLKPEEIAQNHFADLAGYYGLELSRYYRLSEANRAILHDALMTLELGTPDDEAIAAYEEVLNGLYYDFTSETEAADFFRAFAAEYGLDVTSLKTLSPLSQERVFEAFAENSTYTSQRWFSPILQKELEELVEEIKTDYFGESVVHTLTEFRGFQIKKGGELGMRAVFTLDQQVFNAIHASYGDEVDMTVGAMILPESMLSDPDAMRIEIENGEIRLPEAAIASAVAYANGAYDPGVFRLDGEHAFACEFFPEGDDGVNVGVVYLGYAVLQLEGADPVIYYIDATSSFQGTGGLSLYELTRYAKLSCGMAYENIQEVMNATTDKEFEDIVLSVGVDNIGDYVIVSEPGCREAVAALQELLYEYVGIRLSVVDLEDAAAYDRVLRVGTTCDILYEDMALYGLAVRSGTIDLWYLDNANADPALALLEEILEYARNGSGSYQIAIGTDIVRRVR